MKPNAPDILDLLAAEFVLGTLTGAARRRFERWRGSDPFVARRVQAWEVRLAGLAMQLEPVDPSPKVWATIERRIGNPPQGRWRGLAAAVVAFAVLGLGWYLWQELRVLPPQATAVIADASGSPLWQVAFAADGDHVEVRAVGDIRYPDQRSRELWALPPDVAPVSLGLMPERGRVQLALDARQRAALALAPNVAVSDEPLGGSPTGAPTGAVLFVAPVARS
ncbi:MAG: anti-sigma factor [Steroidobacteraceae bacterium]